ncbi:unnamed protein product [Didymodactylos carnosus]|uniref:Serine protease n=1 Tax=Didymodactylos carnosus TaxID=1234261 RepID=A0A815EXL5_9BILA|nr:unnamed protein product [Didymodactylos carnosus]CAF1320721.1 unnamed protein product [Didymodactylos carnosus]CAF3718400.1 unnamed protein product [Didymodactylos carnosus]CAF4166175.1 unnamed protein product [Didymodactylos carnosus]
MKSGTVNANNVPKRSARNVFGKDDRVAVTLSSDPWRTIGYVYPPGCTGTLVGEDLVLTAAHCVIHHDTNKLRYNKISFYPNMINQESNKPSDVIHVWHGNYPKQEGDWALLRLNLSLATNGTHVGYSGDFMSGKTAGAHVSCKIVKKGNGNGVYLHNCDTTIGASGGPIFALWAGRPYIYALAVAERRPGDESLYLDNYSDEYANIAIWSQSIGDTIAKLRDIVYNAIFKVLDTTGYADTDQMHTVLRGAFRQLDMV